jgi:hypothetical protein
VQLLPCDRAKGTNIFALNHAGAACSAPTARITITWHVKLKIGTQAALLKRSPANGGRVANKIMDKGVLSACSPQRWNVLMGRLFYFIA